MENILGIAINKGSYENPPKKLNDEYDIWEYDYKALVLDPLFWQALGKSCGWNNECKKCEYVIEAHEKMDWNTPTTWGSTVPCGGVKSFQNNDWKYHALRFHEINLTEGWESAIKYLESITSQSLN